MYMVCLVKKGTNVYDLRNHTTPTAIFDSVLGKDEYVKNLHMMKTDTESVAVFSCHIVENTENLPRPVRKINTPVA